MRPRQPPIPGTHPSLRRPAAPPHHALPLDHYLALRSRTRPRVGPHPPPRNPPEEPDPRRTHRPQPRPHLQPGDLAPASPPPVPKPAPSPLPALRLPTPIPPPTTAAASKSSSTAAPSADGTDALGDGDIKIATVLAHPHPTPDLNTLPAGTRGNVIVDIVIDTTGHITSSTLSRGLGHPIDDTVLATIQQWTFQPATRNGIPVTSEQELVFFYERG